MFYLVYVKEMMVVELTHLHCRTFTHINSHVLASYLCVYKCLLISLLLYHLPLNSPFATEFSHLPFLLTQKGEVGGDTCRMACTWWLLGLAVKVPWLRPAGPILTLAAWTSLKNTALTLLGVNFWQGRLFGF